jgi:hypothetical protein
MARQKGGETTGPARSRSRPSGPARGRVEQSALVQRGGPARMSQRLQSPMSPARCRSSLVLRGFSRTFLQPASKPQTREVGDRPRRSNTLKIFALCRVSRSAISVSTGSTWGKRAGSPGLFWELALTDCFGSKLRGLGGAVALGLASLARADGMPRPRGDTRAAEPPGLRVREDLAAPRSRPPRFAKPLISRTFPVRFSMLCHRGTPCADGSHDHPPWGISPGTQPPKVVEKRWGAVTLPTIGSAGEPGLRGRWPSSEGQIWQAPEACSAIRPQKRPRSGRFRGPTHI